MSQRDDHWLGAGSETFDAAIIGGGVNGACLHHELSKRGHRTLLIERGDFAGGTSQSSGMMIWGGLLYLRNLEFRTVSKLCKARERMIQELPGWLSPTCFRYVPSRVGGRDPRLVRGVLLLYWMLGGFLRRAPTQDAHFGELRLLREEEHRGSHLYEEASLVTSDARFVLHWIASHRPPRSSALNYCELGQVAFDPRERRWRLDLRDALGSREVTASASLVVNCAGVWTDEVNARYGIRSPYKHVFSKGVYLGFQRPSGHATPLIFDMGEHGDTLTFVPWGPISLWGPTETPEEKLEDAFRPTHDDVRFLLRHANRHLREHVNVDDIVSLRCGVRPLGVKRSFSRDCYPLDLSRRSLIHRDPTLPWISTYGGKITGCLDLAGLLATEIEKSIPPGAESSDGSPSPTQEIPTVRFPGIEEALPSPGWCAENEFCCTLDDYLRRRTNISQWTLREGLGRGDEHLGLLREFARELHPDDDAAARSVEVYRQRVRERFDAVLAGLE